MPTGGMSFCIYELNIGFCTLSNLINRHMEEIDKLWKKCVKCLDFKIFLK